MTRVLLILVVVTSVAGADVPSPEEEACQGKAIGASCEGGACAMTKCSRSRPGPDGTLVNNEWDCMRCVTGASGAGDSIDGGEPSPIRIALGIGVAVLVLAGGIWLARRKLLT